MTLPSAEEIGGRAAPSRRPRIAVSVTVLDHRSPNIIEILRSTLERVEKNAALSPDDPALQELRRMILRMIVELEIERDKRSAA